MSQEHVYIPSPSTPLSCLTCGVREATGTHEGLSSADLWETPTVALGHPKDQSSADATDEGSG